MATNKSLKLAQEILSRFSKATARGYNVEVLGPPLKSLIWIEVVKFMEVWLQVKDCF